MRMAWCDVMGRALSVGDGNNSGTASWLLGERVLGLQFYGECLCAYVMWECVFERQYCEECVSELQYYGERVL